MTKKKALFAINGKPSSLREIRRVLKDEQQCAKAEILRDGVTAKEAQKFGMSAATLRAWRISGRLRARKVESTWYYSRLDLLELIKTKSDRP